MHLKSYVTFLPQVFSSNIYIDFQKDRAKWQSSVYNHQWLTPWLTTTFAKITQPIAIQNNFVMLCLDNFSRQNKLDTKMQRANSTEMNFTTANCKIRKKDYVDIYLFYQ